MPKKWAHKLGPVASDFKIYTLMQRTFILNCDSRIINFHTFLPLVILPQ